jgi:triosephosphate isomerase
MAKKIIVGNWKMNPKTGKEADALFTKIKISARRHAKKAQVVVCPPALFIERLAKKEGNVLIGAQDSFFKKEGAFTGSVSPAMIKSAGASYVILGHSERRAQGDTDEIINKKVLLALEYRLAVILCVGETVRDEEGNYLTLIADQLLTALQGVSPALFKNIIVAYEPVWAIGEKATGADTPAGFLEIALYIKKTLAELVGKDKALSVPVLYGGSVSADNAKEFLHEGKADGLLVGRASLNPKIFSDIISYTTRTQ